ncbi:MAG: hypothetical protein NZ961_19055 [Candidatus Poribacteria bacterium]|nr:hypothetical protein [Candidatus Poribacteria bacterium]
MTTMKSLCVIFLAVAFPHSTVLARAFEDQFGRTMEADLISHTGISSDIIKIRMGGKQLDVEINLFSDKDQNFIRNWMKETPPKIDYAFRVEATLKQLGTVPKKTSSSRSSSSRTKTKTNVYEIHLTNLTRQTVRDLRLEYRIVKEGRSGKFEFQKGSKEISEPMRYNQDVVLTTAKSELDSYRSSYSSYSYKEAVLGILVRVFDQQGELVTDWRSTGTKMGKISWEEIDRYLASRKTSSSRTRSTSSRRRSDPSR